MCAHFDTNTMYLAIFFSTDKIYTRKSPEILCYEPVFGHFPAHQPVMLDNFPLSAGIQAVLQEKILSFKYTHLCKLNTEKKSNLCLYINVWLKCFPLKWIKSCILPPDTKPCMNNFQCMLQKKYWDKNVF